LHGSPIPAKSGRRSSENDPLREEGAKRSQKGKRPPRRKAPENTRAAVRGALPVFPGKKSPSIPHGEAILPIKPALPGGTARRTSRQTKPPSD